MRIATCSEQEFFQARIEILRGSEIRDIEVHAVAPEPGGDGGDVDALGVGVGVAEGFVEGEEVLKWEDGPHGGRIEVLVEDALGEVCREFAGGEVESEALPGEIRGEA